MEEKKIERLDRSLLEKTEAELRKEPLLSLIPVPEGESEWRKTFVQTYFEWEETELDKIMSNFENNRGIERRVCTELGLDLSEFFYLSFWMIDYSASCMVATKIEGSYPVIGSKLYKYADQILINYADKALKEKHADEILKKLDTSDKHEFKLMRKANSNWNTLKLSAYEWVLIALAIKRYHLNNAVDMSKPSTLTIKNGDVRKIQAIFKKTAEWAMKEILSEKNISVYRVILHVLYCFGWLSDEEKKEYDSDSPYQTSFVTIFQNRMGANRSLKYDTGWESGKYWVCPPLDKQQ